MFLLVFHSIEKTPGKSAPSDLFLKMILSEMILEKRLNLGRFQKVITWPLPRVEFGQGFQASPWTVTSDLPNPAVRHVWKKQQQIEEDLAGGSGFTRKLYGSLFFNVSHPTKIRNDLETWDLYINPFLPPHRKKKAHQKLMTSVRHFFFSYFFGWRNGGNPILVGQELLWSAKRPVFWVVFLAQKKVFQVTFEG